MVLSIDLILDEIKKFYLSNFWRSRFYRRVLEENINITHIHSIYNVTLSLIEDVKFKLYYDVSSSNGLSYGKIIELNKNIDIWEKDPEHFENLIMHEFGHLQYNDSRFKLVEKLNSKLFYPLPLDLKSEMDIKYFSDKNEIRQRVIPIIKTMLDNNWTAEEAYNRICKYDDIFDLYSKKLIIYWIDNIL